MATFSIVWIECISSVNEITIYAITNLGSTTGKSIAGGEWLAIEEINNNTNLLPNYKLKFQERKTVNQK